MLSLLAFSIAQLPEILQPPRLRTILPNGATILVERVPNATRVWTRLFLSARGAEETPASHGMRHLLEHLVATGRDGRIDERLEREGATLTAQTQRDAMEFAVDAPGGKLDLALGALGEMLRLRALDAADVAREVGIVRQEGGVMEPPARLSAAAWRVAYGESGLAPYGDLAALRAATPASIAALHRRLCTGPNLVVVVAGDVDLDAATAAAAKLVRAAPRADARFAARPAGKGARTTRLTATARRSPCRSPPTTSPARLPPSPPRSRSAADSTTPSSPTRHPVVPGWSSSAEPGRTTALPPRSPPPRRRDCGPAGGC